MPWRNSSGGTCSPDVLSWLDLGVALAADSGALALRFFKESPLLLGLLEPAQRQVVLTAGLELADRQSQCGGGVYADCAGGHPGVAAGRLAHLAGPGL